MASVPLLFFNPFIAVPLAVVSMVLNRDVVVVGAITLVTAVLLGLSLFSATGTVTPEEVLPVEPLPGLLPEIHRR
ncbi:hypothetical protein EGT50_16090 [Rhodococcus xishaensis]|uniref:Uncharacterized protein n=1 Tax=Rhodococcus xishaensis TaxID=2487364 RepID=A0A3S3A5T5_9NOCA|nr:hypothetical protein EGT50_16090 [Rhodococcus xishaensis]